MAIVKYGWQFADDATDASIELEMFYRGVTPAQGGLGRFEHMRNAIDLLYNIPRRRQAAQRELAYEPRRDDAFIWNDWSELIMRAFCEEQWVTVTGPNACVAGETRIWNPLTGASPTIQDLCTFGIAPVVMTLDGPEQAEVPFVKGIASLFEVTCSDGSRFKATAEHLVRIPSGDYVRVGSLSIGSSLLGYERDPLGSNSVADPSVHGQDARDSQRRAVDFQVDYRPARHCDDGRLLQAAGSDQSCLPLQGGALEHSQPCSHQDGSGRAVLRTRPKSQVGRPSNSRFFPAVPPSDVRVLFREHRAMIERACGWLLFDERCRSRKLYSDQDPKPVRDSVPQHLGVSSSFPRIRTITVTSIISAGRRVFYDIGVPRAHHYFAEGVIHHNSWKTTCAAMYGLMRFYSSPTNTIVVITSTSLPGLRKRIWKEVTKFHRLCPAFGKVNASDFCIRFNQGSDDAGVFGVATGQDNDIEKAVEKIIGFHATNVIATIDEAQATNEALVKAGISLEAGADHYQCFLLGNADSELDPHGTMSEPVDGWESISVEEETWRTKRGIAVHLDCYDCPRVKEGDEFYPGMLRQADIDSAIRNEGEDSPYFWQFRRGFWAPQGITKTILSTVDANRFRAKEDVIWIGKVTVGATLDPAYEGTDLCVLRQHLCGMADIDGEEIPILWHGEMVIIKLKASKDRDPIHYQIAKQTVENCDRWGVKPHMFALDVTGEGEGPAGVLVKEHGWGGLMRVDFNGAATTEPISDTNRMPANKKYDRRVTELWFRYRSRVRQGQIRGLDSATLLEFCQRRYEERGNGVVAIETKTDMKSRTHRSPDRADNAVMAEELFRKTGVIKDPVRAGEDLPDPLARWKKLAKKYSVDNADLIEA